MFPLALKGSMLVTMLFSMAPKDLSAQTTSHTITLGAGCFWCVEAVFESLPGVVSGESGIQEASSRIQDTERYARVGQATQKWSR